jgi:hypothetical protein
MKHCLAGLGTLLAFAASAQAQPQIGSYSPPVVNPHPVISPYLNLNRSGVSPAINYYGIVKPQIENRQALQNLQQQVQTTQNFVQNQATQMQAEEMAPTGRTSGGYFNYSHFFPGFTRGGSSGSGSGMPGMNGVRR